MKLGSLFGVTFVLAGIKWAVSEEEINNGN